MLWRPFDFRLGLYGLVTPDGVLFHPRAKAQATYWGNIFGKTIDETAAEEPAAKYQTCQTLLGRSTALIAVPQPQTVFFSLVGERKENRVARRYF
jgi:hypothetical protein